ncbi:MAG TPA: uroporphyrinogen-III C-methyltransferase [Methanomassiliicoccales archaeon]|nr:uroporphyrinogen-III C-methyltransferase [Methanomassiliicoccales archaeon]
MRLGTRGSDLAMAQTEMVVRALAQRAPGLEVEIIKAKTLGDEATDRPLRSLGGVGAFTKELDRMILDGRIDAAVNSLKDMPAALTPGTMIAAVLPRGPAEDVLVSRLPLDQLPSGAVVGTSSVRRAAMVRRARPDLRVKDLRGNVPTRLRKLQDGQYDAVILARAGIERLGIDAEYHVLNSDIYIPSAGQGAIAVVCAESSPFIGRLALIDHAPTRAEVEAERLVLGLMGGGCYIPIGVHASAKGGVIKIDADMMLEDGSRSASSTGEFKIGDEKGLKEFATDLLQKHNRAEADPPPGKGEVFLVGAGPGDPGLITVKGLEVLRSAEVVVHDALVGGALLESIPPEAEVIDVGKRGRVHRAEQDDINRLLVCKAMEGKRVVRLKGGDPFLFGRGGEEAEELRIRGVRVHVVPGITSALAAPSLAGIPVTHRRVASHVTFVTGHEGEGKAEDAVDWEALAHVGRSGGTIVILMGIANIGRNSRRLMEGGMDHLTPAAIIEKGSMSGQRTVIGVLGNIAEVCEAQGISPPAVIVIGEVARLREKLGDLF